MEDNFGMSPPEGDSGKYNDMLERVNAIVGEINSENLSLDDMVIRVEEGYELIKKMRKRLDETKMKVEKLRLDNEASD